MQRDILQMQDQLRTLQRSQDEKLAAIQVLLQQALESSTKANTTTSVLEASLRDKLKDQERNLVVPLTGLGTKVDQMSNDFASVRESMADLTSRVGKMQNLISDLSNSVRTLSAPPAPPPSGQAAGGPPAGLSAEQLYTAAMRDRTTGNADLAIAQFKDFLAYFGNTDMAPNAQYYIGEIEYLRGDYNAALIAFDKLIESFPENPKTPDALLLKGRALIKSGFKAEGRKEFETLVKRFPSHENAAKARAELRALGSAAAPARKKR